MTKIKEKIKPHGKLVLVSSMHYCNVHFQPINVVVYNVPLVPEGKGNIILRLASRLDAFSGYLFRT